MEGERNTTSHDQEELHVIGEEVGVAGLQNSANDASMGSNGSTYSRCNGSLDKRHMFGVALLVIVDLIWVGSAGLTKYLFNQQSYNKPFFTVYFKTVLFTIYLLPFVFWRPWQRLCCTECKCKRKRERVTESINFENNIEYKFANERHISGTSINISSDNDHGLESDSFNSSVTSNTSQLSARCTMLGPSQYAPLKCHEECELPLSLNLPRCNQPSSEQQITSSSSAPLNRRNANSRVRFSRTVEVKRVPSPVHSSHNTGITKPVTPLSVRHVVVLALCFGILWFFANYLYARALDIQSVAAVNTLSSVSGVFVLIMAAFPYPRLMDKDRFTLTKVVIIMVSVGGTIMVGLSSSSDHTGGINFGALYAVGGAGLYACYLVFFSKAVPNHDCLEIPMFFGFVGLVDALLLLPLLAFWHYTGIEEFELPPTSNIWTLLLINGFIGTVLSELLWLWGCLLTSSLLGTLSLSLITPLSLMYSIVVGETEFSILFFFGALLLVVAFIVIAIIDHSSGWDPLWVGLKRIMYLMKDYSAHNDLQSLTEESKCLLRSTENCSILSKDLINSINTE